MKSAKTVAAVVLLTLVAMWVAPASSSAHVPAYHLVKTTPLSGTGGWDYLTLDSSSRRLFIARGSHVTVVNIDSGKVVGDIPNLHGIHGVAIDHKTGHGFVSEGASNSVAVFSLASLRTLGTIPVGRGPDAILFDPSTSRVFTFNGKADTATAIDTRTDKVVGVISLPGKPEFPAADGAGHIYDNIEDKSEVAAIDTKSLKVEHLWPIAPGEEPSGIAIDPQSRRLFSVCHNQLMTVISADNGSVKAALPIGNGPDAVAFDVADKLAFSSNGQDGTLSIIEEKPGGHFATAAIVVTRKGARTLAFDPKTRDIFTVTAKTLPPAPGDKPHMRRYVPGSFVLLEYGP